MATGTFPPSGANQVAVSKTFADTFVPELWSDSILVAFKANLVLGSLVTSFNMRASKGDRINIPAPTRAGATAKTEHVAVTLTANTESTVPITIDQHFHVARLLEDEAQIQALDSLMGFYTDDAGFALAAQVDTSLHEAGSLLLGGVAFPDYGGAVIGSDGSTAWSTTGSGNGTSLTDAGIRRAIRTGLDDPNNPQSDRALVIPPIEKENLLGLARFTEQAFVGEVGAANSIRNGRIGSIYGVDVFVSTNVPIIDAADSTKYRPCLLLHKSALALAMQNEIRVQTQDTLEFLATLMVADVLYGVAELRNDGGIPIIVPNT